MIDLCLHARVGDGHRQFELRMAFATEAPVVALFGPSGAGKSLTLQAIAGLLRPRAGHVRVAGRTLFDSRAGIDLPPERRRVGCVFQHYALFPHLDVRQNVAFGLSSWRQRPSRALRERVETLLDDFGLQPLAASRPDTLSGGQKQRVALARALACEPGLLLLDEPFAALNPALRQQLRGELLACVRRWQVPALVITHEVEDVLALANQAYCVEGGRVTRAIDLDRVTQRELVLRELGTVPALQTPAQGQLRDWLLAAAQVPLV
ncbi:ATP-binding cassette domain-containing protein [Roseateles saccharophilus]|uniref:Molybdate transport system ATP-binding protein n=1 Tax=Roseateles saccharophilus TaxID=304 RepID=A0A4V2VSR8_ROSSA|nr:ATP-binding cassette domain-containing protein [Roseateles saccharophilus]MDG0832042.1 ATP-binding cassette domain-containing protein [Roseateles saccharophilus]TCV03450.1 molybdate transport system ATP-binding protein [Roseateles saccharophilus]